MPGGVVWGSDLAAEAGSHVAEPGPAQQLPGWCRGGRDQSSQPRSGLWWSSGQKEERGEDEDKFFLLLCNPESTSSTISGQRGESSMAHSLGGELLRVAWDNNALQFRVEHLT